MLNRRQFLATTAAAAAAAVPRRAAAQAKPPNIVIIFADDLGYGDLSCFGHPTIRTPNLDRLAADGVKLTQFYSAASVCTPSRAALLTGRLPVRTGMCSSKRRVLFPNSGGGLQSSEMTIGRGLKSVGYRTGCVGKWHLGHLPQFLPDQHGFDEYFGIPYSNDMKPSPLLDGTTVVEEPADQTTLTRRYTERAVDFIQRSAGGPFFLYFPHTFPHVPLYASDTFKGTSPRGLYGDVVEELDWSVGQVRDALRQAGVQRNTLLLFTSDNGPWLTQKLNGGSAGLLRDGKGSTWEGGMREPFLAAWPGRIPAGSLSSELGSTLDFLPTAFNLAGVPLPTDRVIDGVDLMPALAGGPSLRQDMPFWRGQELFAFRQGKWKAHRITQGGYGQPRVEHDPPALYQLDRDPSETFDVAEQNERVVKELQGAIHAHLATIEPVPSQLEIPLPV